MTTLNVDLFDALKAAGVEDATARRAAQSVVAQDARVDRVGTELGRLEKDVAEVRGDVRLLKWMIGANLALTVGVLLKLVA